VSRSLGAELPEALLDRLLAAGGAHADGVVVLATVDAFGWPHPALVSYAELLALDPRRLRLALHRGSRSARQLAEAGRATLVFADPGLCLYVKGEAVPLPPAAAVPALARFELVVRDVLADRAEGGEAGARLTTGLTVAWPGAPAETAARHARLRRALAE
jgi:hypothetical protein